MPEYDDLPVTEDASPTLKYENKTIQVPKQIQVSVTELSDDEVSQAIMDYHRMRYLIPHSSRITVTFPDDMPSGRFKVTVERNA